jgi:bifunctional UDP-N-acetylglucosamine pyrophosphorylase/glucosamine-1-phosphate N-acetyltransferase
MGVAGRAKSTRKSAHAEASDATVRLGIAILAAGKGTRLKSKHPKVLHQVGGRALLEHVIATAAQLVLPQDIFVVIGHEAQRVREAMQHTGVNFVLQREQLGTGDALRRAQPQLRGYDHVLVLYGDTPLVRPNTLQRLRDHHLQDKAAATVLTAEITDPTGYGRIIRKTGRAAGRKSRGSSEIAAIVEQKALKPGQERIREINSGIYCFRTAPLFAHLGELTTNNPAHEFYLTDMAAVLGRAGELVLALSAENAGEVRGVNSRAELASVDSLLRDGKSRQLMAAGVTIFRPETCLIDSDVAVGQDSIIEPFVQLRGGTRIGDDCHIGSYCVISNAQIGNGVEIRPGCIITDSVVAGSAVLGPYSHLRPGSEIGEGAHVGNFVETKKARLGRGAKANHLTYLGDADVGEGVNVGAGTITCNYDGVNKHATVIERGAFIGSDTTLVAPVRVGAGAYVGAASCITQDVPADALAVARGRQVNKEGWARQRQPQQPTKKAEPEPPESEPRKPRKFPPGG